MKRSYVTDLSDAEWWYLELHVPTPNKRGRPKTHTTRQILNAIFYVLKSGCSWRMLPRDFPPWEGRLLVVREMAHRRDVGAVASGDPRALADQIGEEPPP
jgi:transposase